MESSRFDSTSLEDLVAMAQAHGIHVEDETDRSSIVWLLQAAYAEDEPRSSQSPSPSPAVRVGSVSSSAAAPAAAAVDFDSERSVGGARHEGDDDPEETSLKGVGVDEVSPTPRPSPASAGWQNLSPPHAPKLSDILAAQGLGRALDDGSSSMGAEAGTDAGSVLGGVGGGPAGEGGFDGDTEADVVSSVADVDPDTLSPDDRQEALDTFMGVTQVRRNRAAQFLEATEWNVGAAINLFMESGGEATPALSSSSAGMSGARSEARAARRAAGSMSTAWARRAAGTANGHSSSRADSNDGEVNDESGEDAGTPDLANLAALAGLPGLVLPGLRGTASGDRESGSGSAGGGDEGPGDQDEQYPGGFSPDGVRAPIPNRRDRLIGGGGDHILGGAAGTLAEMFRGSLERAGATAPEEDHTDWIFSIPEGLSFPSDFVETRQLCKAQKKWLMVNIQDHEEFASHRLNKDVWSNETILTLLRGNFIFWQRNKTLSQARYYIEKYNIEGQVLPHTAILDPRTGAQLLNVVGYVEPEDLSMALVEFLEENSVDQVKAPKVKTMGLGNIARSAYNDTRDKESHSSDRASPEMGASAEGRGSGGGNASFRRDSAYESFGSEEYVYEDDADEEGGQGVSFDGEETNSRISSSNRTSNSRASPALANSPLGEESRSLLAGSEIHAKSAGTDTGEGPSDLPQSWGEESAEDELRQAIEESLKVSKEGDGEGTQSDNGEEENKLHGEVVEDVPQRPPEEPEAGQGVTQVRFRLPSGGGTISRRFWMEDPVNLLYDYVRMTVDDASTRPFDLLSGHPPLSLKDSKLSTVEEANLHNSAIMVRWL